MRIMADTTLADLSDVMARFVEHNTDPDGECRTYLPLDQIRKQIDLSLPEDGDGETALAGWVESYLKHTVPTGNWRFLNQLWGGFSLPGVVGEVASTISNTSMFTYEVAPVATLIEQELIGRLGELVGFTDADGLFVTGGSNANLVAMAVARYRFKPSTLQEGSDGSRLQIFVSDQSHYSFNKAANLMGLGLANVIRVSSDSAGRMLPEALDEAIRSSKAQGASPFFVGATAGTTVLGAFDPIDAIADICEEHGLWFHIDGAWGGSALMSEKLRHLLAGCERADSFTWDQHKMMGLPLVCSTILLRQRGLLAQTNHVGGSEYIFHETGVERDLGPKSLQCARRVDALKLWLAWKCFGRRGFAERIEGLFALAQEFADRLDAHPRFERAAPVASLNICFRYKPEGDLSEADVDRGNLVAREALLKSGRALINYAVVDNRSCWRLILANTELDSRAIGRIFDEVEGACVEAFGASPA
jgi:glutamate/tyrosine decarboxylase-like PLP-dependent enzyme